MHFTLLGKKEKGKQQKGRTQAKVVSQKSGWSDRYCRQQHRVQKKIDFHQHKEPEKWAKLCRYFGVEGKGISQRWWVGIYG